jgi:hypothetical protein
VTGGGVGAGTTLAEPDQLRERLLRQDGAEEIDGEPEGLDPEQVIATQSGEGASQFVWTDGAFTVGVFGPSAEIEPDEGFAALETAVSGVERTLTSEEDGA